MPRLCTRCALSPRASGAGECLEPLLLDGSVLSPHTGSPDHPPMPDDETPCPPCRLRQEGQGGSTRRVCRLFFDTRVVVRARTRREPDCPQVTLYGRRERCPRSSIGSRCPQTRTGMFAARPTRDPTWRFWEREGLSSMGLRSLGHAETELPPHRMGKVVNPGQTGCGCRRSATEQS